MTIDVNGDPVQHLHRRDAPADVTTAESLAAFVRGFPAMSRQTNQAITRAGPAPATHFMHCGAARHGRLPHGRGSLTVCVCRIGRSLLLPPSSTYNAAMLFVPGDIPGVLIRPLKRHTDRRGWLIELFRDDELPPGLQPVMGYISLTLPGVARGPHEHLQQSDCFGFVGPGDFRLHLWDNRPGPTFGHTQVFVAGESAPSCVVIPPGVVHAYLCISPTPGIVYNFPNALYAGPGRKEPVDEVRHEADPNSPFRLP